MSNKPIDLDSLQRDADAGRPQAQYNLGVYCLGGSGGERNVSRARELFEKAAEQDFAPAMSALGYLHLRGQRSTLSIEQAARWFEKAAELGFSEAQYRVAELSIAGALGPADPHVSVAWLEKAAEQGHTDAQCQLAYSLDHGIGGPRDSAAATAWYGRAMAQDSPRALFNIGWRYFSGHTLDRDPVRARACFLRASRGDYLAAGWAADALTADLATPQVTESARLAQQVLMIAEDAINPETVTVVPEVRVESWEPRIFRFPNLLSPEECAHLIQHSMPYLHPSRVFQRGTGEQVASAGRRSASVSLANPLRDMVIWNIEQRLARYSLLPASHGEPLTILRYCPGDEYRPHYDYFDPAIAGRAKALAHGGQRIATFMVYLNTVVNGGITEFPDAGIQIVPEQGSGLLFFNTRPDGKPDPLTRHAGRTIQDGEKWVATRWIREAIA